MHVFQLCGVNIFRKRNSLENMEIGVQKWMSIFKFFRKKKSRGVGIFYRNSNANKFIKLKNDSSLKGLKSELYKCVVWTLFISLGSSLS